MSIKRCTTTSRYGDCDGDDVLLYSHLEHILQILMLYNGCLRITCMPMHSTGPSHCFHWLHKYAVSSVYNHELD